jgi:formate hydrogenlyase subunit 3/multisubunit Na+/H+ antiporter MnhD subunit
MERNMIEIWIGVISFVTGFVSFVYGTRICWECAQKCHFREEPQNRKNSLKVYLPIATALYLFGFILIFGYFVDGFIPKYVYSLTSAILLSHYLISLFMPDLKRQPTSIVELKSLETSRY